MTLSVQFDDKGRKTMRAIQLRLAAGLLGIAALTGVARPASAQMIYDPWSGMSYDASGCYSDGYNSCYVDNYGDVHGSYDIDPSTYYYDDYSYYTPLDSSNNYYAPSTAPVDTYVPYESPSNSHEAFINSIWE